MPDSAPPGGPGSEDPAASPENGHQSESPILRLEGIRFSYRKSVPVLRGVDLEIGPGELVALVGASGSGKSTLLAVAGLLSTPEDGSVQHGGFETRGRSRRELEKLRNHSLGFVFQHHFLLPDFTVAENVAMPLWIRQGRRDPAVLGNAGRLLEELGIGELADRRPHELSGGERQRVAVARAVFPRPGLILADEPTGSLDSENGQKVLNLLVRVREDRDCAVLVVTHDAHVAETCDRAITMKDGRIVGDERRSSAS